MNNEPGSSVGQHPVKRREPMRNGFVAPFLQWFDTKLLGRPFLQRIELDFVLPTGQFDRKYVLPR